MSTSDIAAFLGEVESVVERWNEDELSGEVGSGVDWSAVAQAVVDRNADRLAELRHALREYTSSTTTTANSNTVSNIGSNTTSAISHVRLIAFALVMPYVDGPSVLSPSSTAATRKQASRSALENCARAFTYHISRPSIQDASEVIRLSVQETRLERATEGVLSRICSFSLDVLVGALDALDAVQESHGNEDEDADAARTERAMAMMRGWLGGGGGVDGVACVACVDSM